MNSVYITDINSKTVSEKISDIESIVHTTSVTAEASAASSEELSSQSRTLQDMVN